MLEVRVIALFSRLPELTHEAFRDRYESGHVPLIQRLLPPFGSYRRNYVCDPDARARLGYDVITEAWFANTADHARVVEAMSDPAVYKQISDDEAQFIDQSKSIVFLPKADG